MNFHHTWYFKWNALVTGENVANTSCQYFFTDTMLKSAEKWRHFSLTKDICRWHVQIDSHRRNIVDITEGTKKLHQVQIQCMRQLFILIRKALLFKPQLILHGFFFVCPDFIFHILKGCFIFLLFAGLTVAYFTYSQSRCQDCFCRFTSP